MKSEELVRSEEVEKNDKKVINMGITFWLVGTLKRKMMKEDTIIQKKAFAFAIRIVRLFQYLLEKREYVISKQILRSGTSIGANLEEAQGSPTRKDFYSKMTIVYKEARETRFWLLLLRESHILTKKQTDSILTDCEELLKIIGSILKTLKEPRKKNS